MHLLTTEMNTIDALAYVRVWQWSIGPEQTQSAGAAKRHSYLVFV